MSKAQIFQKGDALTPQRFWQYAIRTENKHGSFYNEKGFRYSEKHTNEYNSLSDEAKKKVSFIYINGIKQIY